jgi:hypothetical protein
MNDEKLVLTRAAIYEVGLLFNQSPSEDKIKAYSKALANYTPKQITFAFNQVILSGSAFFPSLAEILKHLKPTEETKEDRAPIIVKEILGLIRDFHPFNELAMIEAASEDARLTILAMGGTSDIRNAPSENIGTTQAQLERLVKGVLAAKTNNIKNERLEKLGISTGKVLEFRTMDYSGFLPSNEGNPA